VHNERVRSRLVILALAGLCAGSLVDRSAAAGQAGLDLGRRCKEGSTYRLTSPTRAYYGVVQRSATAYSTPGYRLLARFGRLNVNRVPTVFGVLGAVVRRDCLPAWFRVQLPLRPNGVTGFVRAEDVTLESVETRIVVDLSDRQVTVYSGGREVLRTRATIGSPQTPTPTGRYYVNQRLRTIDASGPFGPGGIGISAFSPILTSWAQGGPVAIHGTNEPWLIGQASSNGCIRVENSVLRRMWSRAREGTPVIIRS